MDFKRLTSADEILELIYWHNANSEFIVIDVETTSEKPREAKLIDVQISGKDEDSAVIFEAEYIECLANLSRDLILVAHNYKYDAHVLYRHGADLLSRAWRDTLLMAHLADENRESYSLDSFVKEYWNDPYKEEFWAKYKTYQEATPADAESYACKDIVYTSRLYRRLILDLRRDSIQDSLVFHTHRLQSSLLRTEIDGIQVDIEYLQNLGIKLKQRIDELGPQMRSLVKDEIEILELEAWQREIDKRKTSKGKAGVGRPVFSFESSKQLSELLYGRLSLRVQKNEKTKAVSTDYTSLERIKEDHPIVGMIQENRELQKVYTAYVEGTLERLQDGYIYPEFRVSGTKTGRISHSNPNLGQLPKSGGVRGIYIPRPAHVFISADYSQLEVCLEANLTGDASLAEIFEKSLSKHDITARELGVSRDVAKTLNFALQYWASHYKVAKLLGVSEDAAKKIWEDYWKLYSGPRRLKGSTDRDVDKGKPIVTAFGRKRRFKAGKRNSWDSDYRQAYNFLIQGTGADITSRAFYLVSESLLKTGFGRGLFTVHDEILIEVKKEHAKEAEALLLKTMVAVGDEIGLKIPLKAESSGPMDRWQD